MKTNNISFPHPVLGINQGVLPDLDHDALTVVSAEKKEDTYVYTFELKQDNQQITQYIEEENAVYMCEVDCEETLYKRKFISKDPKLEISIKKKEVTGHVNFHFYVVTTRIYPKYSNSGFNGDYIDPETGQMPTFYLESGSVLVAFPSWSDNISTRFGNKPMLSSFIQVVNKGGDDDKKVSIDLNNDIINVELPQEMFADFLQFNNEQYVGLFYASLIQNALVKGILNIEDNAEREWADCIRAIMEKEPDKYKEYSLDEPKDAVDIATTMLSSDSCGSPYDRLFSCIKNLQD